MGRRHLKESEQRRIIEDVNQNELSYREIAEKYGISISTVSRTFQRREEIMDYKNPEGYADPTAYRAINPDIMPGEIWEIKAYRAGENKLMVVMQIFDNFAICAGMQKDLSSIPDDCEERTICRDAPFVDCSKPGIVYKNRFIKKCGELTVNKMITIRQKVADIILRGYAAQEAPGSPLEAPQTALNAEADKIPVETEKARETPVSGLTGDAGEMTRLRVKAEIMEQVAGRLFGILEKQAERG